MTEENTVMQDAVGVALALQPWRQELFEKVARITAIVATPAFLVGVYYLYATKTVWMIPLAVIAYGIVVAGALVPRINYVWRVWAFIGAVMALGIADLIGYGWGEDARIYLMSALLFATIFLGGGHGLVAMVISCLVLTTFVVAVGLGLFSSLNYSIEQYSLTTLITSLAIFIMLATALFTSFNYLFPRLFSALQESAQLSRTLEAEREALSVRTNALQESNLNLQRRTIYFDAITQVSRTLTTIFDVQPLLEQAVAAITYHFELEHVGVFLMDDIGAWATLRAASSAGGREMIAQGYRVERGSTGLVGQAVETRETQVANAESQADFASTAFPSARSATALPLIAVGELVGVLEIQSTEDAAFDQDNVRALEGMAGQLAVAIDNARRFNEDASVSETRNPSYRLAQRLAMTNTEMDVCAAVLDTVSGFNPAHAFVVRLPLGPGSVRIVTELRDGKVDVQDVADLQIGSIDAMLATSAGLEGPLMLSDLTAPLDTSKSGLEDLRDQLMAQSDIRSVALVPLRVESDLLSVLLVAYDTQHIFTPLESQLYRIIKDLGGAALARIKLIQDAEARVERERWLREFGERVMRMPDLDTMMVQAAESLLDAVQADGVVVSIAMPEFAQTSSGKERV